MRDLRDLRDLRDQMKPMNSQHTDLHLCFVRKRTEAFGRGLGGVVDSAQLRKHKWRPVIVAGS